VTYLVDTDWVASYLNGRTDAIQLLNALAPAGLAISLITYGEIYDGIYRGRAPGQAERGFKAFLTAARVLPLTRPIMRRFARIRGDLRAQGLTIGDNDVMIAATALQHGLTLVSRNHAHFARIPGLNPYP
jgi:tRNA(fMet)-specific endonuclease VapC